MIKSYVVSCDGIRLDTFLSLDQAVAVSKFINELMMEDMIELATVDVETVYVSIDRKTVDVGTGGSNGSEQRGAEVPKVPLLRSARLGNKAAKRKSVTS